MPSIQIRDVPPEVHVVLRVRAAREGISLSAYVLQELRDLTSRPTVDEWLDSLEEIDDPPSTDEVVQAIREGRDERDRD